MQRHWDRVFVVVFSVFLNCLLLSTNTSAQQLIEKPELTAIFSDNGISGTFVFRKLGDTQFLVVNGQRATKRYIPASTFKIANSLIALETQVVSDIDEIVPFGGKPQPFKSWERDMSMRDAIAISNVPVYQNLAQRIGLKNYQEWLAKLDYGNRKTGNIIDRFWLDGPLLISAVEQVQFLEKLISKDLAVSAKTQQSVMEIIRLESSDSQTLFGKTGWTQAGKPALGWFVGWVKTLDEHYSFALNMDIVTPSDAKKRKPVTKQLLKNLGVYSTSQSKH